MEGVADAQQGAAAMAGLLQQLAALEQSDPAEFERVMTLLEKEAEAKKVQGGQPPVGSVGLRKRVMEQIRASQEAMGCGADAVKLPGNKTMGSGGNMMDHNQPKVEVTPEPGFVVKTSLETGGSEEDQTKVFINVCQSDMILEPSVTTRLDDQGNEVEGTSVPVSVGPPRVSMDKSGRESVTYDVIVNPKVVQEAADDKTGGYRDFLCQLCITYVEGKYKCSLSKKYKLPKLKYQGEVATQFVKDVRNKPTIQEVPAGSGAGKKGTSKASQKAGVDKSAVEMLKTYPRIRLCWCGEAGEEESVDAADLEEPIIREGPLPQEMKVVLEGVELKGMSDEALPEDAIEVSLYTLAVNLPGYHRKEVTLPFPSSQAVGSEALLYANNRELHVRIPVDQTPWCSGPDPGSKAWLLAQAITTEDEEEGDKGGEGQEAAEGATSAKPQGSGGEEVLPEDRFHLKLPDNVDPYSGVPYPPPAAQEGGDDESIELPEDRFHKADFMSQHIIEEREKGRNEKQERWAKDRERQSIKNDPDVEYIDVADFKPGGKYGPPATQQPAATGEAEGAALPSESEELKKAAEVVRQATSAAPGTKRLSNKIWSKLLD